MNKPPFSSLFFWLARNPYLNGLCNVFVMLLPVTMLSAFCTLLAQLMQWVGWAQLAHHLSLGSDIIWSLFPVLLCVYFSVFLSALHKISRVIVITPSLIIYFILCFEWQLGYSEIAIPANYPLGILLPILVSLIVKWLTQRGLFVESHLPNVVDQSFNLLFSTTVIVIGFCGIGLFVHCGLDDVPFVAWLERTVHVNSLSDALLYEFARNLLWSMGINGHVVLAGHKAELYALTSQAMNSDVVNTIYTSNFFDLYAGIGGAGNTLALVLCLLMSRQNSYRSLGVVTLLFGLFNINEPLLFGLPIIFNPFLVLPFLLAPLAGIVIAYIAITLGWVAPIAHVMSWMTPPFMNSYLGSDGTFSAVALQLVVLVVSMAIYYPFLQKMFASTQVKVRNTRLASDEFFDYEALEQGNNAIVLLPMLGEQFLAQKRIDKLMKSGQFILYYQPQMNVASGKISGVEVLIRYQDKTGRIYPPDFIKDFVALNLMSELDFWVIKQTLDQLEGLATHRDFRVSINVSPQTCLIPDFAASVIKLVERSAFDFAQIELEITEEVLIQDEASVQWVLQALRQRGIQVALDDFGSGYSSIGYLSKFDFDKVKIDRSLVMNMHETKGRELLKVTCQLVRITGAEIVVEGIERQEEVDFLKQQEVHLMQGYFYHKPMPLDALVPLIG